MKALVCDCMEYIDPNHVCDACGYPVCETEDCAAVPGCDHNFADAASLPSPLRKKLRTAYASGAIEYHRAIIQCFQCEQSYCEECYDDYAIRYMGYMWTPHTAYKYAQPILRAAMGLYLLNKRNTFHNKLPREILIKIVGYL